MQSKRSLTQEDLDLLSQYRPMLNTGVPADVGLDEIMDGMGQSVYLWRCIPGMNRYIPDALIREGCSEDVVHAYDKSVELKTLMLWVMAYATSNAKNIDQYLKGRRNKLLDSDGSEVQGLDLVWILRLSEEVDFVAPDLD